MTLDGNVYPLKVKLFYNNLTVAYKRRVSILWSYVQGKVIRIDRTVLRAMFELNRGESKVHFVTDEELRMVGASIDRDSGLIDMMRTVCVARNTPGNVVNKDLYPKLHILHLWLRHNVLPSKGHFEAMMPFEIYVLYYFMEGIILDLPNIILHEMAKIREGERRALGFGALLTMIFKATGIDLSTEVPIPSQAPFDKYTIERSHVFKL